MAGMKGGREPFVELKTRVYGPGFFPLWQYKDAKDRRENKEGCGENFHIPQKLAEDKHSGRDSNLVHRHYHGRHDHALDFAFLLSARFQVGHFIELPQGVY